MDRFIVNEHYYIPIRNADLKSNMDRFIDRSKLMSGFAWLYLKSNMDRFIDLSNTVMLISNEKI